MSFAFLETKMYQFLIVIFLSLVPYAILQTEDPYICEKSVMVNYFASERTPLEAYGSFAGSFKKYGIQGVMQNVLKTKMEIHKVCCPGYENTNSLGLSCQPISTTTTESSDDPEETTPIFQSSQSIIRERSGFNYWPIICGALLILTIVVALTLLSWHFVKQKRLRIVMESHEAGNELDARTALFSET